MLAFVCSYHRSFGAFVEQSTTLSGGLYSMGMFLANRPGKGGACTVTVAHSGVTVLTSSPSVDSEFEFKTFTFRQTDPTNGVTIRVANSFPTGDTACFVDSVSFRHYRDP